MPRAIWPWTYRLNSMSTASMAHTRWILASQIHHCFPNGQIATESLYIWSTLWIFWGLGARNGLCDYPLDTVPKFVHKIFKSQMWHSQRQKNYRKAIIFNSLLELAHWFWPQECYNPRKLVKVWTMWWRSSRGWGGPETSSSYQAVDWRVWEPSYSGIYLCDAFWDTVAVRD
jgi:hypothetical protein